MLFGCCGSHAKFFVFHRSPVFDRSGARAAGADTGFVKGRGQYIEDAAGGSA